ncbi:MAG: 2-amino-4-hydroxy-6-hydroxymethyldihydropteridine diphosphokinase [Idiomarina sp.]
MALVHLGIGSNLEKHKHIRAGVKALLHHSDLQAHNVRLSRVFRSAAVGFAGRDFFNLVMSFHTSISARQVNDICKEIEQEFGHSGQVAKFSPRTLDIDVLLYNQQVSDTPVQLPRAEIIENAFVLWPLAELSPLLIHPVIKQTYARLWQNYQLEQRLEPVDFDWSLAPTSK